MARLSKDDLIQMNRNYFQSLEKERLVEVADKLHQLAVKQWKKINSNSSNSSQPPSGDNPFQKLDSSSRAEGDYSPNLGNAHIFPGIVDLFPDHVYRQLIVPQDLLW